MNLIWMFATVVIMFITSCTVLVVFAAIKYFVTRSRYFSDRRRRELLREQPPIYDFTKRQKLGRWR